jgi:hypothetical protein
MLGVATLLVNKKELPEKIRGVRTAQRMMSGSSTALHSF